MRAEDGHKGGGTTGLSDGKRAGRVRGMGGGLERVGGAEAHLPMTCCLACEPQADACPMPSSSFIQG